MKKGNSSLPAILIVILVGLITFSGVFFLLRKRHTNNNKMIISNPISTYGTIVGKTFYKGKGVTIEYKVNQKIYTYKPSVSDQFYFKYNSGDTVAIIYYKNDPSIVELKDRLDNY